MKKLAVLAAIVAVAALAAPAMSATNPFMDVPMNHWAYDAIGQLAAHGILSGFPDGLYKGGQQTTRYEMASALARSLAVVDMTKASKQDVEMLKKLVVEFKDELEALGVRVDELDERVALIESRLGGWHIHGTLVLDLSYKNGEKIENAMRDGEAKGKGEVKFDN
ncbi:MAG: S-layer homology domain-containing protein, partial [Synergistaceae bacterium]|nr:S-layer homology domain-containing protein [Synergistaceae bacterium]